MKNIRTCIYAKDVQCITGKGETASRNLLHRIRKRLHKKPHQMVSIQEFCDYTGLPKEEIRSHIN